MSFNMAFKALADGTRREILRMLQKEDLSAGEIAAQFSMSKPSISHHLNILKQADLVQDLRKGQNIYYSLNTTVFQELIGWFYELTDSGGKSNPQDKNQSKDKKGSGASKNILGGDDC
ncbi:MAG: autorepressor SdpR family transcription factor [Syntrophomonadaceae bacterium]|nr:autorepressor SdpR family transcription factor [Syntrophomonadaceae bacterium]